QNRATLTPKIMPTMLDLLRKQVFVNGPFWRAGVSIVQMEDPIENLAFRTLFLDNTSRQAKGGERYRNLFLPGTLLLLCRVAFVRVTLKSGSPLEWKAKSTAGNPPEAIAEISKGIADGTFSLLLVEADPKAWTDGDPPEFTCLAGEIDLGVLTKESATIE